VLATSERFLVHPVFLVMTPLLSEIDRLSPQGYSRLAVVSEGIGKTMKVQRGAVPELLTYILRTSDC